jgi:hypothetical protein
MIVIIGLLSYLRAYSSTVLLTMMVRNLINGNTIDVSMIPLQNIEKTLIINYLNLSHLCKDR